MDKFITRAQAAELKQRFIVSFHPPVFGTLGIVRGDDYYVVPDDDPRLQSPEPVCDTKSPT